VNRLRKLHADRRRAQRGSVLSGVMIITAFIAIIAGAMMTELSANFTLSHVAVNRVANEATVKSAIELSLDSLQNSALASGCPALPGALTLNGRTAVASYISCFPVVDVRSPQFTGIASSAAFNIDGTHSVLPTRALDLYVVGDSSGNVYQYTFGNSLPNWSVNLKNAVTGPPLAMPDNSDTNPPDPTDISFLIPIAGGTSTCSAIACVELEAQRIGQLDFSCPMPAGGSVTSRPAAGMAYPTNVYFGDGSGTLWAYDATENAVCSLKGSRNTLNNAAIVAGPVVFKHGSSDDEVYVVTSKGGVAQLLRFTYDQGDLPVLSLVSSDTLLLPYADPVGLALETSTVPSRLVITFSGGQAATVQIDSSYHPSLLATRKLPSSGVNAAPYWCSCPTGPEIGVGGNNGSLYVLDPNLNMVASYGGVSSITTTPGSDGVGEWYFGTDDGNVNEVQQIPGQGTMTLVRQYGAGTLGQIGSSVQVAGCPAGICIYLGSLNGNAYLVPLNARDATITACLSDAPPVCSGVNPRLWAQAEVGDGSSPRTVHIGGWSYYSP
jgi:hypothetical protein